MKYKIIFWIYLSFVLCICSCSKQEDSAKFNKAKILGSVQKGPYINGTSVQMFELNSELKQTGKTFSTQISNNKGSFELDNIALSSQFVEFAASGYYFNEINGQLSPSVLSLYALADITDLSTVNVNILTHLEKSRVEYLVQNGNTFSEAKTIAQKDILSIFGFQDQNIANSEVLDITVNSEANAILLAISIILQGQRSVAELTELLSNIINDIKIDGTFNNQSIIDNLRISTMALDSLPRIRAYLTWRYNDLGINATIPDFEKYLELFLKSTGSAPKAKSATASNITDKSATLSGLVMANDLPTTIRFQLGTSYSRGYNWMIDPIPNIITGRSFESTSAEVTNLNSATLYYFDVFASNKLGGGQATCMFTTLENPLVKTTMPTNVTRTSAVLNAIVNANDLTTSVTFDYGRKTYNSEYDKTITAVQSPISGSTFTSVSAEINGLNPKTWYNYRVKTTNTQGTITGRDITFLTSE